MATPAASMQLHPASVLHAHALESIFGFFGLKDLHDMSSVCKNWRAAVATMRSIEAYKGPGESLPLTVVCNSSCARHIGDLRLPHTAIHTVDAARLRLITTSCPRLRTLLCHIRLPSEETHTLSDSVGPLCFPPTLTHLMLISSSGSDNAAEKEENEEDEEEEEDNEEQEDDKEDEEEQDEEEDDDDDDENKQPKLTPHWSGIKLMLQAVAALPLLQTFDYKFQRSVDVDLSIFHHGFPALTNLELDFKDCDDDESVLTANQLAALHALPRRIIKLSVPHSVLRVLLAAPRPELHWQDLGDFWQFTVQDAALLQSLPSLTTLTTYHMDDDVDRSFLAALPNLRKLGLLQQSQEAAAIDALRTCPGIERLTLFGDYTSDQLSVVFASLPRLRFLCVRSLRDSLRCFESAPATLEDVELLGPSRVADCQMTSTELRYLSCLGVRLRRLRLWDMFSDRLTAETKSLYQPCSAKCIFPNLVEFDHYDHGDQ